MTTRQKAVAWGMGILLWVNLLSILLSLWQFGYVDWTTVAHMGVIALVPLAAGAVCLYRFRPLPTREELRVTAPLAMDAHTPVRAGR